MKGTACSECNGEGYEHQECETCGRDGWVEDPDDGGTMSCPECGGDSAEPCCAEGCEDGYIYN